MAVDESAGAKRRRTGWIVGVALVVIATAATSGVVVARRSSHGDLCGGLVAPPAGLDSIPWKNGITVSGPSWVSALTEGVRNASPSARVAIASAVSGDDAGYGRLIGQVDENDRWAFDRLRFAVTSVDDPADNPLDPETARAIAAVNDVAARNCNLL